MLQLGVYVGCLVLFGAAVKLGLVGLELGLCGVGALLLVVGTLWLMLESGLLPELLVRFGSEYQPPRKNDDRADDVDNPLLR